MGGLPRRDLVLLPLISLVTLLLMLAGAEVTARIGWPQQKVNSCNVPDRTLGFRYKPNCSSTMKAVEGPWYTNHYNACGYRSATPCGPVPAGTRRIALIGTSLTEGYLVEYPDTIAGRLATDLGAMCGRPVDVQNLAAMGYAGRRLLSLRMDEALTLRPDAVLFVVLPYDIESELEDDTGDNAGQAGGVAPRDGVADGNQANLQQRLAMRLRESRAVTVAEHFLFQQGPTYLSLYLRYGDRADFLRPPFSAAWQERLRRFEMLIAELAQRSHRANVPFTLAFVPQQAQLMLMAGIDRKPGVDPTALPRALAAIASRHGVDFIDTSAALRAERRPGRLYYVVDGHPSGVGQPILALDIARHLTKSPSSLFSDCRRDLMARESSDRASGGPASARTFK